VMAGDHLQRHLPHSPRVLVQRLQHRRVGRVVPGRFFSTRALGWLS
jgi:hypothetical protein